MDRRKVIAIAFLLVSILPVLRIAIYAIDRFGLQTRMSSAQVVEQLEERIRAYNNGKPINKQLTLQPFVREPESNFAVEIGQRPSNGRPNNRCYITLHKRWYDKKGQPLSIWLHAQMER